MRWNKSQRNKLTIEPGRSRDISRDRPYKSDPYIYESSNREYGHSKISKKTSSHLESISKFSPVCV